MKRLAGLSAAVVLLVVGVVVRDLEAVAIAALLGIGVVLLGFRGGLVGRVVLGVLFLDIIFWMTPAAISNATHGDAVITFAVPLLLIALSVCGLGAVFGLPAGSVLFGSAALLAIAFVVAFFPSSKATVIPAVTPNAANGEAPPAIKPSEWVDAISAKSAQFSRSKLTAANGKVAVVFHNSDLFWHTFTVDKLGVNIRVPLGATRVVHFKAPPGTYEFYCAIPGHKAAGMKGTLVVS